MCKRNVFGKPVANHWNAWAPWALYLKFHCVNCKKTRIYSFWYFRKMKRKMIPMSVLSVCGAWINIRLWYNGNLNRKSFKSQTQIKSHKWNCSFLNHSTLVQVRWNQHRSLPDLVNVLFVNVLCSIFNMI